MFAFIALTQSVGWHEVQLACKQYCCNNIQRFSWEVFDSQLRKWQLSQLRVSVCTCWVIFVARCMYDRYWCGFKCAKQAAIWRWHSWQLWIYRTDDRWCYESLLWSVISRQWHPVELSVSRLDAVSGRPKLALLPYCWWTIVSIWFN